MTFLSVSSYSSDFSSEMDEMRRTQDFLEAALSLGERGIQAEQQKGNTLSSLTFSDTSNSIISWISQSTAQPFLPPIAQVIPQQKEKFFPQKEPLILPPILNNAPKARHKIIAIPTILQNLALDESIEVEIRIGALENPLCPESAVHKIIKNSSNPGLRAAALKNKHCSASAIQSTLNTEMDFQVINAAVSNSKVMGAFLEAVAYGRIYTHPEGMQGFNSLVRIAALKNPSCPIRVCEAVWNSKAPPRIRAASLSALTQISPLEINKIVNGKFPLCIRIAALRHPKCPKSTVRSLALNAKESEPVRSAAAANKNCPAFTLEFLYNSPLEQKVHMATVGNRTCPLHIVREAAENHPDPSVQASGLLNLKCPDSIRRRLLLDISKPTLLRAAAAKSLGSK